jgi:hypothetical protein
VSEEKQAAMKAAQDEVLELADRIAAAIPEGTRIPLVINALKHTLAATVIRTSVSENAARGCMGVVVGDLERLKRIHDDRCFASLR